MRVSDRLQIFSQMLNFFIFLYFSITLIRAGFLDVVGLLISAVGLLGSLVVSIIGVFDK